MEAFHEKESKSQFHNEGYKASDKYYLNQDARNEMLAQYKKLGP